jgi:hypothetical protein
MLIPYASPFLSPTVGSEFLAVYRGDVADQLLEVGATRDNLRPTMTAGDAGKLGGIDITVSLVDQEGPDNPPVQVDVAPLADKTLPASRGVIVKALYMPEPLPTGFVPLAEDFL